LKEFKNIKNIKYICEYLILIISDFDSIINPNINFNNKNCIANNEKIVNLKEIVKTKKSDKNLLFKNNDKEFFNDFYLFDEKNSRRINAEKPVTNICNIKEFIEKNTDFINIRKLIKYLTKIFEIKLDLIGKKLDIFYKINNIIPEIILSNEKILKQIIFNLLSNAIKFTNRGRIGIYLDYNKEAKKLIFKIIDSGRGIEADTIKKIGQSYFKTFHNNNDFGIGMGICIVKKHVKSLKGEFIIESIINKGTTVIIELPYEIEESSKRKKESESRLSKSFKKFNSSNKLLEIKQPIFQGEIEDEIKLKSNSECGRYILTKKLHKFRNSSNIRKKRKKSIFVNTNATNCKKSFAETVNPKINFLLKDKIKNKSTLKIGMPITDENEIESSKDTFKIIYNQIENFNFNNISLNSNLNYPIISGNDIKNNRNRNFSILTNNEFPSLNTKSSTSLKSKKMLFNLSNITHSGKFLYSPIETPISNNNKNSLETEKKIAKSNNSIGANYYTKDDEKELFRIKSNLKIEEDEDENPSFSSVNSKDITYKNTSKIDNLENSVMSDFNKDEKENESYQIFEYNLKNHDNNDKNCILISEPLVKKDREERNLKSLEFVNKIEKPDYKKKEVYLMKSSSLLNNSKDETLLLDKNLINKNLNSLKSEFPQGDFYKIIKIYQIPDNKILKIEDIEKNINNETELENVLNKSNRLINNLEDTNITMKIIEGNQFNNINENQNYNVPISKFKDFIDNNINDTLNTHENQNEKRKIESNKILCIVNGLNSNNNFIPNSQEKGKETLLDTPQFSPRRIKTNNSNFSKHSSNYRLDKSGLDSYSSRFNANNKTVKYNEAFNIEISPEIESIFANPKYKVHKKNIDNKLLNVNNKIYDQIIQENNLLKSQESYLNGNREEGSPNSAENSNIQETESRISDNHKNNNILRILVVDDEKLIRRSQIKLISKYLEKNKILYEIEDCEDGIECLYKVYTNNNRGNNYDIIITDETMNFMKGTLMAKILKILMTDNVIDPLKIFMVTSYEAENYSELQGDLLEDVFTKPLSMNNIKKIFNFCEEK